MATLKYSRQREAIKDFLMTRKDHPTADVVYENIKKINFEGMHYDFTSLIAEHESAEDYCKDSDELNSKIKIYQEQYEKIESFFAPQEMIGTIQRIIKSNKGLDYSCTLRKLQECSDLIL